MSERAMFSLLIVMIMIRILSTNGSKSGFPVESGIGSNQMKRCYKEKLDFTNPKHHCNHIIDNILYTRTFVPHQTSCITSVFDILPVQYCIGGSIVSCKRTYYETLIAKSQQQFIHFQDENPTPAMLFYKNGSDSELGIYVFDHQHMSYALATSDRIPKELKYLKICIIRDLRKKFHANEMDLFWQHMMELGYSYPYDQYYAFKNPVQYMPLHILQLVDDPFRSLAIYVQDYMGFIFCNNPKETVNALNFSRCFGKKGVKWQQKYGNVGLTLIWSEFLYQKLQNNPYAVQLYRDNNTLEQMKIFRELLPLAMQIAFNGSDGAKKLPSFNNQPTKIHDLNHLQLYDDGCDKPMQRLIWSENKTKSENENMIATIGKVLHFGWMDRYLIGVFIMGMVAVAVELRRYYDKRAQLNEEYSVRNILMNGYGSTCTVSKDHT
eukprot:238449_1